MNHEGGKKHPGAAENAEILWCGPKLESSRDTLAEISRVGDGIIGATMNIYYYYNKKRSGQERIKLQPRKNQSQDLN